MSIQSPPPPSAAPPSAPPRSPAKSWLTKRNVAIAVVLIFLLLLAVGSGASNQGTITKTATVTTSIVQTVTVTEGASVTYTYVQTVTMQATPTLPKTGEPGTSRFNPLALGKTLVVGEWEISVIGIEHDAYGKIKEMNMFNSEPEPALSLYSSLSAFD